MQTLTDALRRRVCTLCSIITTYYQSVAWRFSYMCLSSSARDCYIIIALNFATKSRSVPPTIVPTGLEYLFCSEPPHPITSHSPSVTQVLSKARDNLMTNCIRGGSATVQYKVTCIKTEGTLVVHWGTDINCTVMDMECHKSISPAA